MIADAVLRGWVVGYTAAALTAIVRAMTRAPLASPRESSSETLASGSVVLVRPLAGEEAGLAKRLVQTGGARFVLLAVGSRDDAAEPIAQNAADRLRAQGVNAVVVVTRAARPNHKADQLAHALDAPLARLARTVVVADSDVELEPDAVDRLVEALDGADAAWAPPVELGPRETWGDHASQAVLDASLHSFPLLAGIDPRGLVGKLFAVRRDALDAVGGFGALAAHLGEDMELARRLCAAGRTVVVAPQLARSTARGRSLGDVLARYRRWLLVIRMQRPLLLASYPLLLAPSPLLLLVLVTALATTSSALATAAAAGLAVRVGVACAARLLAGLPFTPLRALVQAIAGDLVLLLALAGACASREVTWRGRRLSFTRAGTLRDASGREEAHEEPFGKTTDEARLTREDGLETRGSERASRARARGERGVDPGEFALDPRALPDEAGRDVALRVTRKRTAEGNPELRVLRTTEDVTKPDRDDERALRDARDLRGTGPELEGGEWRTLAALREDPERSTRAIEEARGMADGARPVGGVVEVDPERADATEEGYASEVRRIHHRVPVAAEEELRYVEGDERIPPRRVIGDEQERRLGDGSAGRVEPGDLHAAERVTDARARVASEPGVEPAALGGGDHGVPS